MKKPTKRLRYCMYARKSSESDDRQTASLDSQLSVMTQKAQKMGIEIVHILKEAHSAKESGTRKGLEEVLKGIRTNQWNAIITWAPDRLSRNAGDIGKIIDLMDAGKLKEICTSDQIFKNTPDDKFLLMILTSQAKLENDYRGKNVMRGMRAVCHTGKRPGPPPLGYKLWRDPENISAPSEIVIDTERAQHIKELFRLIHEENMSTRQAKKVINANGFTTSKGNPVSLSTIIKILKDSFYTGEFEYPKGSGSWYTGTYKPIITKEVFEEVQEQLKTNKKSIKNAKLQYLCNKVTCHNCKQKLKHEVKTRKQTIIQCLCNKMIFEAKEFYQELARFIMKKGVNEPTRQKIKSMQAMIHDFTGEKITFLKVLVYLLKNGSRADLYRITKDILTNIFLKNSEFLGQK